MRGDFRSAISALVEIRRHSSKCIDIEIRSNPKIRTCVVRFRSHIWNKRFSLGKSVYLL